MSKRREEMNRNAVLLQVGLALLLCAGLVVATARPAKPGEVPGQEWIATPTPDWVQHAEFRMGRMSARFAPQAKTPAKTATAYRVTGAGDRAVNGVYRKAGTRNGAPYFRLDDKHYLCWDPAFFYGSWGLGSRADSGPENYARTEAAPSGGKWIVTAGTVPPPVVSAAPDRKSTR